MNEPRWRTVLNWSAVIMFFTMPLIIFVLHLITLERHGEFAEHIHEFSWLGPVYTTVSTLVFGLAGLNSWDKTVEKKFNGGPKDGGRRNDVASKSDQRTIKPN